MSTDQQMASSPASEPQPSRRQLSRGKRWLFGTITFLLVWMVCELVVVLGTPSTMPPVNSMNPSTFIDRHRSTITALIEGRSPFVELSTELGWTHKPWGERGAYRANGQRMRADHDYSAEPAPDTLRVATFGDSFMFGADVEVEETWQYRIEHSRPRVEVLNFGVSGYGTDQALLRYLTEGVNYSPEIVVLGYIVDNSRRNMNTFKPFYLTATGLPIAKPRFVIEDDRLVLKKNPLPTPADYQALLDDPEIVLPKIGEHDTLYRQFKPSTVPLLGRSPTFRATRYWVKRLRDMASSLGARRVETDWYSRVGKNDPLLFRIFDAFVEAAEEHHARPLVMLFPTPFDYEDLEQGDTMGYTRVAAFLEAREYPYVDVADFFQPYLEGGGAMEDLFALGAGGGHYSAVAQALITDAMVEVLDLESVASSSVAAAKIGE